MADFVLDGPVLFSDCRRVVAGRMQRLGAWSRNGFVVVHAAQTPTPALRVEFHAPNGTEEVVTLI